MEPRLPAPIALATIVSLFALSADAIPPSKQAVKRFSSPVIHTGRSAPARVEDIDNPDNHKEHSWKRSSFPLRVYFAPVEKGVWRYKPTYVPLMRQCFQNWSDATNQFVQFRFVDSKPYDIKVVYVNQTKLKRQGTTHIHDDCFHTTASIIDLAISKDADTKRIMHVGEHEIGHAIGLKHSLHPGIMHAQPGYEIEFISKDDLQDVKRIYKLDDQFHPLMLNDDDRDKYRLALADALRKFYKAQVADQVSDCEFSFEVDADGHIYNYKVNEGSPLRQEVLTVLVKADPLPKPPSYFCDHLRARGVLSGTGILEVRELQPCN